MCGVVHLPAESISSGRAVNLLVHLLSVSRVLDRGRVGRESGRKKTVGGWMLLRQNSTKKCGVCEIKLLRFTDRVLLCFL